MKVEKISPLPLHTFLIFVSYNIDKKKYHYHKSKVIEAVSLRYRQRRLAVDPGIQGGVTLPDLAPIIYVGFDHEDAADRTVVGEPGLAPGVLQLLYPLAVPQYPITPTFR